MFKIDL